MGLLEQARHEKRKKERVQKKEIERERKREGGRKKGIVSKSEWIVNR